jgi:CRISPR-associated endoribonuclease Cas6
MTADAGRWYASVLQLETRASGLLPRTHGHQVHALFLDLVRSVAPELSAALHSGSGRRPFTLSPLSGLPAAAGGGHHLAAGAALTLRVTILDERLFSGFLAALLSDGGARDLRLGALRFALRGIATGPDQHPWAGVAHPPAMLTEAAPERAITLRFATPTAFSLGTRAGAGKVAEPLPRPELVFGGLLSAWNAFSGVPFDLALRQVVAERIVVSRFSLRSAAYRFRDHVQVGVVGSCTYDIKGALPDDTLRHLNALADAARFLGVGYRTTMGMGQARRITAEEHDAAT